MSPQPATSRLATLPINTFPSPTTLPPTCAASSDTVNGWVWFIEYWAAGLKDNQRGVPAKAQSRKAKPKARKSSSALRTHHSYRVAQLLCDFAALRKIACL